MFSTIFLFSCFQSPQTKRNIPKGKNPELISQEIKKVLQSSSFKCITISYWNAK